MQRCNDTTQIHNSTSPSQDAVIRSADDTPIPPIAGDRFLTLAQVSGICGMGRTYITDAVRHRVRTGSGDFPLPIKIGAASRWLRSEIYAWMERRVHASRNGRSA